MMDENLKRDIILDHYQNPRNKGLVQGDDRYKQVHMASDSCIDDITVQTLIEDGYVKDAHFDGIGCTIATASTSIFVERVVGLEVDEALKIIDEYYKMIDELPYDEDLLEEANAFDTLSKQANRIKCGTIGINALNTLLREAKDER